MKDAELLVGMAVGLLVCARALCATHYVSLEGSDQAPYLTPQTAARSVQSAVNVAPPGGTVSVAPGDYREHVLMGAGLVLVGSGPEATRIVGSMGAAADSEIRELAVVQEVPEEDPDYAWVAIRGPEAGGLIVARCSISGTYDTGIWCHMDTGYAVIVDCDVRGIRGMRGEGIRVSDPWGGRALVGVIDGCLLEDNDTGLAASSGDGVWVMRTRFSANRQAIAVSGKADVLACSIDGNETGIYVFGGATTRLESTALTRNASYGVDCEDGSRAILLTNCTITGNAVGLNVEYADQLVVKSCVIWGNEQDLRLFALPGWTLDVRYSDLGAAPDYEHLHSYDYLGNIDADPLFVRPDAGDYRLRPDSPCIDTGSGKNYYACQLLAARDLHGNPRIAYGGRHGGVDMGAYEYHINVLCPGPAPGEVTVTWSSWDRATYSIFYSHDLMTWRPAQQGIRGAEDWTTTSWTDDGSKTGLPPSLAPRRFYRILENP